MKSFSQKWIERQIVSQNWDILITYCLSVRVMYDDQNIFVKKYAESNEDIREKILKCISALEINPEIGLSPNVLLLLAEIYPEEALCLKPGVMDIELEAVKHIPPEKMSFVYEYAQTNGLFMETQSYLVDLYQKSAADAALRQMILQILKAVMSTPNSCAIKEEAIELLCRNKVDLSLAEIKHDKLVDMYVIKYYAPEKTVPYFNFYLRNLGAISRETIPLVIEMYRKFLDVPGDERNVLKKYLSQTTEAQQLHIVQTDFELFLFMLKEGDIYSAEAVKYVFSQSDEIQKKFWQAYNEGAQDKKRFYWQPTSTQLLNLPDDILCQLLIACFQSDQHKVERLLKILEQRNDCPKSLRLVSQMKKHTVRKSMINRIKSVFCKKS